MAIVDLAASCPVCGYDEIQRFYHAIPFHELTLPRFRKVQHEAPRLLGYDCSNCGTPVGHQAGTRGSVVFAFVSGEGVIRSFFDTKDGATARLRYRFEPDGRLDVQALPVFEPDADDSALALREEIDDADVRRVFGRVFSFKAAWRGMLLAGGDSIAPLGPGCWAMIGDTSRDEFTALSRKIDRSIDLACLDPLALWPLSVTTPPPVFKAGLGPTEEAGRPSEWLQETHASQVYSGKIKLTALLDPEEARRVFAESLEGARLRFDFDGGTFSAITTPRDSVYDREVTLHTMLARAAWTAISPAEAARLTAEELIAELMGLSMA